MCRFPQSSYRGFSVRSPISAASVSRSTVPRLHKAIGFPAIGFPVIRQTRRSATSEVEILSTDTNVVRREIKSPETATDACELASSRPTGTYIQRVDRGRQLILISGYPSSGKTYRSSQLVEFFRSKISSSQDVRISKLKIHHHNDQNLGLNRNVYDAARSEKDARATLSSAIKRDLSRDAIVIADNMNYIKGFRYQLYCEAKGQMTPSCVVCLNPPGQPATIQRVLTR